eukprot:SAG31_NODE_1959_length_6808_cov_2.925771_2_plen_62_part_00
MLCVTIIASKTVTSILFLLILLSYYFYYFLHVLKCIVDLLSIIDRTGCHTLYAAEIYYKYK